jgi:hypothetical protein
MPNYAAIAAGATFRLLGIPVTWTPIAGGAPVTCLALVRTPDTNFPLGPSTIQATQLLLEVLQSDLPEVLPGDTFLANGETYTVQGTPNADPERVVWKVNVAL